MQGHEHVEHALLHVIGTDGGGADCRAAARPLAARLARRAVHHLCASAVTTTHGTRFLTNTAATDAGLPAYPGTLYDGAAGVALALLEATPLDRTGRAFPLGREVVDGLVASTPPGPSAEPAGLYLGLTGTAVVVARWALATDDAAWRAEALRVIGLAGDALPGTSDVLGGTAGVGLGALAILRATGDSRARAVVHACVERLGSDAVPLGRGIGWPLGADTPDGTAVADELQTGFAHGDAGIATFLATAAATLDDGLARELRDATYRSLGARMRRRGNRAAWPVSDRQAAARHHWCHGTTGIAQAYLARHEVAHGGDAEALRIAIAAAEHTWTAIRERPRVPADRGTGHCHGLAGALELFVLMGAATDDARWMRRAEAVVRAIARRAPGRGPSAMDADGCGLGYGTAGVLRALASWERGDVWLPWRAFPESDGAARRADADTAHEPTAVGTVPRRAARLTMPHGFRLQDVVPVAAGALDGRGYALPVGAAHGDAVARFAATALDDTDAGRELRRVLAHLRRTAGALTREHAGWLGARAIGEATFGTLVRECAGLLLRPGERPMAARRRIVRALVERRVAGLVRSLDDVARDRSTHLATLGDGPVTVVEHVGGDPHRGGAGVFGFTFADGRRVLHKPRSVLLDAFLAGAVGDSAAQRVTARLQPPVAGATLPRHDIVPVGPWHGYAERVRGACAPVAECDPVLRFLWPELGRPPAEEAAQLAPGAERGFWYSAGLLAGHAACFGVGDLHAENLVFGTSRAVPEPVLHAVDLEMAFTTPAGISEANLAPAYGHRIPVERDAHQHFGLQARHGGVCTMGAEEWCLLVTPEGIRPTMRPNQLAGRHAPNAVRNGDGRFGYADHLCAAVRGFADYWVAVRPIHAALAQAARDALEGAAVRVLVNASRAYVAPRHLRMLGAPLWPGASWFGAYGSATPLRDAELAQLDRLDVPYFFRRLGAAGTRWMDGDTEVLADLEPHTTIAEPFWSVIERFPGHEALCMGLAELVAFGAPEGPFDQRDDALAVRVARTGDDPRPNIAIGMPDGTLRVRLEPDGGVRWWFR